MSQNKWISYGLYPVLLGLTVLYAWNALSDPAHLMRYYGIYLGAMIITMVVIEALHPMRAEWKMTKASFLRRDLPLMLLNGVALGAADFAAGALVLHLNISRPTGLSALPLLPAFVLAVLAKDLFWYAYHRAAHELGGALGARLWRLHVTHHLPQQVYVLMHAVGHPLDGLMARALSMLPLYFLGLPQQAVFLALLLVSFQGLVSHFNVDVRVGWLNYLLSGTELHRYHHSTRRDEAKNYAATTPFWDHVFCTFHYEPRRAPDALGVESPGDYPSDRAIAALLALPFRREAPPEQTVSTVATK